MVHKSASEWVRFCRLVPTYSVILGLDPRIHTQHSTSMSSRIGCPLPLRLSTASTMLGAWILGSSPRMTEEVVGLGEKRQRHGSQAQGLG
ncbi:hypothetical protein CO668_11090 [Rhizobium anhuiense]|nr:hypothetical protein CO668_11090 [Rhizobium anhuiense]